jgi:hypothetical protein
LITVLPVAVWTVSSSRSVSWSTHTLVTGSGRVFPVLGSAASTLSPNHGPEVDGDHGAGELVASADPHAGQATGSVSSGAGGRGHPPLLCFPRRHSGRIRGEPQPARAPWAPKLPVRDVANRIALLSETSKLANHGHPLSRLRRATCRSPRATHLRLVECSPSRSGLWFRKRKHEAPRRGHECSPHQG